MALTKSLADTGLADHVQVNTVNPGVVRTDRMRRRLADLPDAEARLVAEERTRLVLPPSGTRLVQVKVRSVADGTVAVDTLLSSPTGVLVSAPTTVVVRIHRDWETRGILVLAAGLSLVFLIGLVRSVRRGRVRVSPEDVPDADDLELYGPAEVPHVPLVLPPDLTPDPARRAAAGLREPVRPIGGGPRT